MNPNGTPKNLRPPWRKGDPSPNASGRPHRLPISDVYLTFADQAIPETIRRVMKRKGVTLEPGMTFAEVLGLRVWMNALDGDSGAAREIRESLEGKAAQRAAPPGNSGPVEIRVTYDDVAPASLSEDPK